MANNNIDTNFSGLPNLSSSTALHNVYLQAKTFTSVAGTAAADIVFTGSLEGGVMITDFSINANTPNLAAGNWNLVARNPNTAVADVLIGSFTANTSTVATRTGCYTKLSATASNNIQLVLTPATVGTNYAATAGPFTLTLYVTYMNSH